MSNAIAQNATQLAVSSPEKVTVDTIDGIIQKHSMRSIKGVTRERLMLNNSKLFASVCDEVRSVLGQAKGRLPDELADVVQERVNLFITKQVNRVNPGNSLSFRTYFAHDSKNLRVVEKVNALGQNTLALKEQAFGCTLLITATEKKLKELIADLNRYSREREDAIKAEIAALKITQQHINATIAANESLQTGN